MTPQRLIIIVAMLAAFPVTADDLVDRADANGDGYVSLYELRAAYYADMEFNQRIEQSFAEYDTNGDGLISEAERQAQALAAAETAAETTQKTAPRAGMAATASGERAVAPVTGTARAAAAATAAGTSTAPPAATVTPSPAGLAPTPPAGLSAAQATEMPAAETASAGSPGMDTGAGSSAGSSPEVAAATTTANVVLPDTRGLSRSELWIEEIDVDNSGGASITELVASGDGSKWFADSDFASADKNGDGDLDPDELEVLIQSMERRRR